MVRGIVTALSGEGQLIAFLDPARRMAMLGEGKLRRRGVEKTSAAP